LADGRSQKAEHELAQRLEAVDEGLRAARTGPDLHIDPFIALNNIQLIAWGAA